MAPRVGRPLRGVSRSAACALLVAAALVAGCRCTREPPAATWAQACSGLAPGRCFTSRGAQVIVHAPVAADRASVDRAIARALGYWSAPPDALEGWVIEVGDGELVCNGASAAGCSDWAAKRMRVQALDPRCPETAQLVHEVGHVLHHDARHRGAFWCWAREQSATREIVRGAGASPGCAASRYYTADVDLTRGCSGRDPAATGASAAAR